jgi:putative oxidoreductase
VTPGLDAVLLVFRCTLGLMIFMHGYNHLWGPGGVEGTARWFEGLGFRPPKVHALMSGLVELAVAAGLVLGVLTPVACAALIGTMLVAGWTAHRPNGFFIFRDGYEYVLVVAVAAVALAATGPGTISFDSLVGIANYDDPNGPGLIGSTGALIASIGGLAGGVSLLAFGWRPVRTSEPVEADAS